MPLHIIIGTPNTDGGKWYVTDWLTKWWLPSDTAAANVIFSTVKTGGKIEHDGNNGPVGYPQDVVDAIPTAGVMESGQWGALAQSEALTLSKLDTLLKAPPASGGTTTVNVDIDALATKVADLLAQRLAQ